MVQLHLLILLAFNKIVKISTAMNCLQHSQAQTFSCCNMLARVGLRQIWWQFLHWYLCLLFIETFMLQMLPNANRSFVQKWLTSSILHSLSTVPPTVRFTKMDCKWFRFDLVCFARCLQNDLIFTFMHRVIIEDSVFRILFTFFAFVCVCEFFVCLILRNQYKIVFAAL